MTDKEEREAIVRWLRQHEADWSDGADDASIYASATAKVLSAAIERGEHHKG